MRVRALVVVAVVCLATACSSSKPSQSAIGAAAKSVETFDAAHQAPVVDGVAQRSLDRLADKCSNSPADLAAKAQSVSAAMEQRSYRESATFLLAGLAEGLVYDKKINCVEVLNLYQAMRPAPKTS